MIHLPGSGLRVTLHATQTALIGFTIVRLEQACWRISDPTLDEGEPGYVLAFIERLGRHRYEVLWLGAPIGWAYVDSFDAAISAVSARAEFAGKTVSERDPSLRSTSTPLFGRVRRRHIDAR